MSTTNLVKTSLSHIARSEERAKRFKKEIDQSHAIPALLQEHLGWVSKNAFNNATNHPSG